MLRAQLAQSPKAAPRPSAEAAPVRDGVAGRRDRRGRARRRRSGGPRKTAATASSCHGRGPRGRGSRTEAQGDDPSEDGVDG